MRNLALLAGTLLALGTAASATATVQFIPFGDLEGEEFASAALGLSRDGSVAVGVGTSTASGSNGREAQRWDALNGSVGMGSIDDSGSTVWSFARAASSDGSDIVGGSRSSRSTGDSPEAFLWTEESDEMVGLGALNGGAFRSDATAVSDDGSVIVGSSSSSWSGSNWDEACLWAEGETIQALGFLGGVAGPKSAALGVSADGLVVVGESTSVNSGANRREAFRWTEDGDPQMEALGFLDFSAAGNNSSRANAISGDGLVIVGASVSEDSRSTDSVEAFRLDEDEMLALGDLEGGDFMSEALATDDTGTVIVGVSSAASGDRAFLWEATAGMRALKDVLEDAGLDLTDWRLTSAMAISGDGLNVVGSGINPDGDEEGWIAVLPEPDATSLALASVLTLGVATARRRRAGRS